MSAEIIKWIALYVILWLLSKLWQQQQQSWNQEKGKAQGGSGNTQPKNYSDYDQDSDEYDPEAARAEREAKIRKIIRQDPKLADELKRLGKINKPLDEKAIEELSKKLSDKILDIIEVESRRPPLDLDLETKTALKEVSHGGVIKTTGQIGSPDNISRIKSSEYALPRRIRLTRVANGQARMTRHFNLISRKKVLYILEDWSGSMAQGIMSDGNPRYIWSKGVVRDYARQALEGKTKIIFRGFDTKPMPAKIINDKRSAEEFMDYCLKTGVPDGGTHIFNAFARAVADINSQDEQFDDAEIVLVSDTGTDSNDYSMDDTAQVRRMLGDNIRLHVIAIGGDNPSLRKVATTYQVFS